jgi:hypothetical protein
LRLKLLCIYQRTEEIFVEKKIMVAEEVFATVTFIISVADPGCLSRILDPDFYPSRIPIFTHPGSGSRIQKQQPKRYVKKN